MIKSKCQSTDLIPLLKVKNSPPSPLYDDFQGLPNFVSASGKVGVKMKNKN